MKIAAVRVEQPLGIFYLTAISAEKLIKRVRNRPRSSDVERSEDIQRLFSNARVSAIADFCNDPQATFPTPIILGVSSDLIHEETNDLLAQDADLQTALVVFSIPDDSTMIGDVLDGQHRILGLRRSERASDFDLPVVLMFDLTVDEKAFVFSTINSKQTPVPSSLIYDLFALSDTPSPQKTANLVARALNAKSGSPFYRRLKMLGRREEHHTKSKVMLSQGTFAARLQDLITRDAGQDATFLKTHDRSALSDDVKCPLRKYFKADEDQSIVKIVENFFGAVAKEFSKQWQDENGDYVIRKAVGYTALIIVLRHLLEEGFARTDLSPTFFEEKAAKMRGRLGDSEITADNFPSSGAGANKLAKTLLGVAALKSKATEVPDIYKVKLEE